MKTKLSWTCKLISLTQKHKILGVLNWSNMYTFFFTWPLNYIRETMQMALHHDPIRIKRLTISSSCTEDDIILFRDLHLIALHISFSLASLSDSPLRSCSFYEKGCCTLIPTICVGSVHEATLSTFCMPREYPGCHRLRFLTMPENSPSPRSSDRQSLLTPPGSLPRRWMDVRYLDNIWHTIWDPDIQDVQRRRFIWPMSDAFTQKLKGEYSVWISKISKRHSGMLLLNYYIKAINYKQMTIAKANFPQSWTSSLWLKTYAKHHPDLHYGKAFSLKTYLLLTKWQNALHTLRGVLFLLWTNVLYGGFKLANMCTNVTCCIYSSEESRRSSLCAVSLTHTVGHC